MIHRRKKNRYSKSIYCIIGNEFCERFSFYGMRAILSLYLNEVLDLGLHKTMMVYHFFIFLVYFFPMLGAIIADTCVGKYWTIVILSIVYASGNAIMTAAAIVGKTNEKVNFVMVCVALSLIAVGTGGIKPCATAFGGDQFVLPDEEERLNGFYSLFYFAINMGGVTSILIVPMLRRSVKCLDAPNCYPLAFAMPFFLMTGSIFLFIAGRKEYKRNPPEGNLLYKMIPCICYALRMKLKTGNQVEKPHWLDYAADKYDKNFVEDVKITLRILFMFLPLPFFWCLYDQQGSEWVFQASKMDCDLHFFKITPDQMQLMNPMMVLIFIPIIRWGLYPLLKKLGIGRPLQRMMLGGILAAISFIAAGYVSVKIEKLIPDEPVSGYCQYRIYNTLDCPAKVISPIVNDGEPTLIKEMDKFEELFVRVSKAILFVNIAIQTNCSKNHNKGWINSTVYVYDRAALGCYIFDGKLRRLKDDVRKHPHDLAKIRFLLNEQEFKDSRKSNNDDRITINITSQTSGKSRNLVDFRIHNMPADVYDINIDGSYEETDLRLDYGAIYSFLGVKVGKDKWVTELRTVVMSNTISILYQLPQYVFISVGEVLFSITGMEFAYSQAPKSLKSIIMAFWLLTNAIGDLIVVGIEYMGFFKRQSANFFVYAMFMVANLIFFGMLSVHYQYVEISADV